MVLRRNRWIFTGIAAAALCALLLLFPKEAREGAQQGISTSLSVLVPSLFPFMAATQFAVASGICQRLASPLDGVMRRLFGVSGVLAPVVVLSLIGGYPVGAGGIAALYRQGAVSEQEARQAALFAVCAGPGFAVSFIGQALYGNVLLGILLLAAQALSVPVLGVLLKKLLRPSAAGNAVKAVTVTVPPFSQALVAAVNSTARGMLSVCAFVVVFSTLNSIAARLIPFAPIQQVLLVGSEVCGAVTQLAGRQPIWVVAFAVGFGGICVHCQIFGILGNIQVNKLLFFSIRMIQGCMTAAAVQLGLRFLPQTTAVFSSSSQGVPAPPGGSVVSGAVLLAVSICFFISVKQLMKQPK